VQCVKKLCGGCEDGDCRVVWRGIYRGRGGEEGGDWRSMASEGEACLSSPDAKGGFRCGSFGNLKSGSAAAGLGRVGVWLVAPVRLPAGWGWGWGWGRRADYLGACVQPGLERVPPLGSKLPFYKVGTLSKK
jgi:hypothetical protein